MKTPRLIFLFASALALAAASVSAAELATAKAFKVQGKVLYYPEGESSRPLQRGDVLREGDWLTTSPSASVLLVFSNGSSVTVDENSSLTLEELEQEGYKGKKAYSDLKADPSKSTTILTLNYGELNGEVKKLREASTFNVETPLGTAAIRGTVFNVALTYSNGVYTLTVTNVSGSLAVTGPSGATQGGETVAEDAQTQTVTKNVAEGSQVSVNISEGSPEAEGLNLPAPDQVPNKQPPTPQEAIENAVGATQEVEGEAEVSPAEALDQAAEGDQVGPDTESGDPNLVVPSPEGGESSGNDSTSGDS